MVRKDFKIDQYLQIQRNEQGQFPSVDGKDEFHQSVVTRLHDRFDELIVGGRLDDNTENKLRLEAKRVAQEHDFIDQIGQIVVQRTNSANGTVEIFIDYPSGKTFTEEITQ